MSNQSPPPLEFSELLRLFSRVSDSSTLLGSRSDSLNCAAAASLAQDFADAAKYMLAHGHYIEAAKSVIAADEFVSQSLRYKGHSNRFADKSAELDEVVVLSLNIAQKVMDSGLLVSGDGQANAANIKDTFQLFYQTCFMQPHEELRENLARTFERCAAIVGPLTGGPDLIKECLLMQLSDAPSDHPVLNVVDRLLQQYPVVTAG